MSEVYNSSQELMENDLRRINEYKDEGLSNGDAVRLISIQNLLANDQRLNPKEQADWDRISAELDRLRAEKDK